MLKNMLGKPQKAFLNQAYKKFELTIIDDASTDSTPNILKDIRAKIKELF